MIYELLAVGSVVFWSVVAFGVLVASATIRESLEEGVSGGGGAFVCLGLTAIVIAALSAFNPFLWLWHNPQTAAYGIVVYVVIGAIWSALKWWRFVHRRAEKLRVSKPEIDQQVVGHLDKRAHYASDEAYQHKYKQAWFLAAFDRGLAERDSVGEWTVVPQAFRNHKDMLTLWIAYWPLSVVRALFGDWLVAVVDFVVGAFSNLYQSISEREFRGLGPGSPP